ncbi:tRNA epoxyqueuosine(34) reductase QueG [Cysteiniphilum halobium]|uniref:tRNA epoxyqueuosine(34) reductase QueG n=1 Tax=Cysteiniphilum halobium TaxID=2219059 RepID=UPI000E65CD38|nr:tRNA epoxyqueuosine(34) reductase QueG [Cysteiniphilum halobium]
MNSNSVNLEQWSSIKQFALNTLSISDISVTDCQLNQYIPKYQSWIEQGYHADLEYMVKHGSKRYTPHELVTGTKSIIVIRLNYLPQAYCFKGIRQKLATPSVDAAISVYAHGRDYHKVLRQKLSKLSNFIQSIFPEHSARVFTDSAPVLEKPLAEKAGLGWIGKNSNLLHPIDGSFFFIGCIYSNLDFSAFAQPLIADQCGKCQACIKACPTNAIVNNKVIDANKCISYLTIENKGMIPLQYRQAIGNRIYGCDDCQLVCPINKEAPITTEPDFLARSHLSNQSLINLAQWSEQEFLKKTEGSAIRRIGYHAWLRNIYVALGNAPFSTEIIALLETAKQTHTNNVLLLDHINWGIEQQMAKF